MPVDTPKSLKNVSAEQKRRVAALAIFCLFAAFLVVFASEHPSLLALPLYSALVAGVAKVAVEFFKNVRKRLGITSC